jgi:biopolymer transport protein ExbD
MRRRLTDAPEIPIAPMIDCVFLMLVYFMTTSSLERSEADLPFPAGEAGMPADPLPAVDEQHLAISNEGRVQWNGSSFDMLGPAERMALLSRLEAFRDTCSRASSEASIKVEPGTDTPHQAVVSLLDIVTRSGIETIHFP